MPGPDARPAAQRVPEVRRERLLVPLRASADVPVVVLHAGAGFGKSTLARQWAADDARPHETVQVAEHDDAPSVLAHRLLDALTSAGGAGMPPGAITAAEPSFSALVLPAVARAARSHPSPYVLVVDDVHLLTQPGCQEVLRTVAGGVPPGSQLVLLTRLDPPTWLSRARADGRLLEVSAADLAFDRAEGARLLSSHGVPPTLHDAMLAQSEGWPVGLSLMALASPGAGEPPDAGLSASRSDRFVADYLRSEVLDGLSPRLREFLRRTSVLDELTAPACDAVLEADDSASVLHDISRRLPLVVPLGHDRHRYHQLLAEVLRADLEDREPGLVPVLHRRASAWHESRGDADAAIRAAKAAGDLDRVGRLVWSGVPGSIASGRPDRLSRWLGDLDEARVRADRWLSLAAAWLGLQTGRPEVMTRWLLAAEEHAGADWPARVPADEYAANLASIHATIGDRGLAATLALCRGAQQGLPRDSPFRAAAVLNEGAALTLLRRLPEGRERLGEADLLARALRVPVIEANALAWQGLLWLLVDDWRRGAPLVARAHDLVRQHRLDRLATSAFTVSVIALVQAARGGAQDAQVTLGTARRLTTQTSRIAPWFSVLGPLVQARAAVLLDDGAQARTLYDEARAHMSPDLTETLLSDLLADTDQRLRTLRVDGVSAGALTAAELRVLQFLPSRLTFRQIGEHLFVSEHTVKSHAMAIYHKLGVSSRDEAIVRARGLGLVESSLPG